MCLCVVLSLFASNEKQGVALMLLHCAALRTFFSVSVCECFLRLRVAVGSGRGFLSSFVHLLFVCFFVLKNT